jgi:flagellar hook-associated protein FlgK
MVDLVAIGSSGVNVYKRALATVSNNIANMGTEGYSRQVTDIKQNTPTQVGKSTIGNGAYFDRVSRQYDEFLESSLQQATADLESQGATVEFAKRLLDLIGDEKLGATSALSKFFGSAKALSTDPGSTALRNAMYRDAEALVSRFNSLADQIDSLGEQAVSAMEADIEALNGLASQIASVNRNLLKKKLEQNQPPQLLDQRDQLLRDLSQYVGIKTSIDSQGLVSVSLTQSMNKGLLVNKVEGYELSVSAPDTQTNAVTFQVKGGLESVNLSEVSSGSVAGFANFIQGTLSNLGQRLNNIVTVMAEEVNAIQVAGLDGEGREGVEFFALEPGVDVDKGASRGDYDVTPEIQDLASIENGTYSFTYDFESQGWIADAGQSINSTVELGIPGLEFRIAGTPLDGDRFTVRVFDDAASGIRMGIKDGSQIAASSLFRVTPGPNNVGGNDVSINFDQPEQLFDQIPEDPKTVASSASDPISIIPAGLSEVVLKINPDNASDLTIDIMTSDGRHIVGEADTVGLTSAVNQSSFFSSSATYSDSYLNKSGSAESSYKSLEVGFGAFGETNPLTLLRPIDGNAISAPTTTDFAGGFVDLTAGVIDRNSALDLLEDSAINQTNGVISIFGNAVYRGTGGGSEQIASINYPFGPSSPSFDTLRVNFLGTAASPPDIDVSTVNAIAARLSLSTGADLENSPYPVISNVSVEAVTQDGSGQFSETYNFNSDDLIATGRIETTTQYRSEIVGKDIPLFSGDGTTVVAANQLAINGINLGVLTVGIAPEEGYGRLSALDIKTWIDTASAPDVSVTVSNEIVIPVGGLTLSGSGLSINDVDIISVANGVATVFDDAVDIAQSINAATASTGVGASILRDGGIRLSNTNGANIKIASSTDAVSPNLLGISNGTFAGQYEIVQQSSSSTPLSIEILDGGSSTDLNAVGLDTSIILRGDIDEDLGVFVRGTGEASLSSERTEQGSSFVSGLRDRVFEFEFTSDTAYTITDQLTNTVLAERTYSGETEISYQGMLVRFSDSAVEGDVFTIDGNNTAPGQTFDAQGNNSNLMRILDLESAGIVSGQSLTEAYLDLVGDVGNEATQAEISYDALEVLEAQAIEARDRVSGVSLDREAADLIRFQQAYQASAQIIQIATKIFDDMLRIQ